MGMDLAAPRNAGERISYFQQQLAETDAVLPHEAGNNCALARFSNQDR